MSDDIAFVEEIADLPVETEDTADDFIEEADSDEEQETGETEDDHSPAGSESDEESPEHGEEDGDTEEGEPTDAELDSLGDSGDAEDSPDREVRDDSELGESEEDDSEDIDPLIPVKINGVESDKPLSEVVAGYQKVEAADENFRKGSELMKTAEAFFGQFQRVQEYAEGGVPRPLYALIKAMAPACGGLAAAQRFLNTQLLPAYVQAQKQLAEMPGGADTFWINQDHEATRLQLAQERERTQAEIKKLELDRNINHVAGLLGRALSSHGITAEHPDANKVWGNLLARLSKGDTLTYNDVHAETTKIVSEGRRSVQDRLRSLTAEELEELSPDLAKKLLKRKVAQIKQSRPTKKGSAAEKGRTIRPTKPRRRTTPGREYVDSIEDLLPGR